MFIICISEYGLFAQKLKPFESNGLYGYKNESGEVIIEPQYQYAKQFREDYAVIAQNDSLGVIDEQNNLIIPTKFEYLKYIGSEQFIFGYRAKYFGEYNLGLMTSKNEVLISPEYYHIESRDEYFIVTKQSYEVINSDDIYDTREISNKYGIVDSVGNFILEPKYSYIEFLSNGLIKVQLDFNGNYALFDDEFQQLTEYKFMVIGEFLNGLSKVREGDNYGFLDEDGDLKIPTKFESCYPFENGYSRVKINDKWGIIDKDGNYVFEPKYSFEEMKHRIKTL